MIDIHYRLCKHLKLCRYSSREQNSTLIVYVDNFGEYPYRALQDASKCLSSHQPLHLSLKHQSRAPVMIRTAVLGEDMSCYRVGICDGS